MFIRSAGGFRSSVYVLSSFSVPNLAVRFHTFGGFVSATLISSVGVIFTLVTQLQENSYSPSKRNF